MYSIYGVFLCDVSVSSNGSKHRAIQRPVLDDSCMLLYQGSWVTTMVCSWLVHRATKSPFTVIIIINSFIVFISK